MIGRLRRDDDRGAAAVEFAIVLPVLLLLVVGIIDFGRAFNMQIALTQAAREGVRVLALGGTTSDATARTQDAAFPWNDGSLSITQNTCPSTVTATTAPAEITASHPFEFTGTFLGFPSLTLTGRGQMRCNG